jgi:hypothetical protein
MRRVDIGRSAYSGQLVYAVVDDSDATAPKIDSIGSEHADDAAKNSRSKSSADLLVPPRAPVHIIVNRQAGSGSAPDFTYRVLVPLLTAVGVHDVQVQTTAALPQSVDERSPGNAGAHADGDGPAKVLVVVGGDGTAYELLTGLRDPEKTPRIDIALVPLGTANALFHSLFPPESDSQEARQLEPALGPLRSVLSLLTPASPTSADRALTLADVSLLDSRPRTDGGGQLRAHVVVSTALHASILHDAEQLRNSGDPAHQGVSRFSAAAKLNLERLYPGTLVLARDGLRKYDPLKRDWRAVSDGRDVDRDVPVQLEGPFVYLTACLVDRLGTYRSLFCFSRKSRGLLLLSLLGGGKETNGPWIKASSTLRL